MIPVNWATSLSFYGIGFTPIQLNSPWPPLRQGYRPCLGRNVLEREITGIENNPMTLLEQVELTDTYMQKGTAVPGAITKLGQPHLALLITATHSSEHKVTALLESMGQLPLPLQQGSTLYVWIDIKRQRCPLWGLRSLLSTFHLPYIPTAFCSYPASKILFMFSNVKNDICSLWVIYADVYYTEIHKN